MTVPGTISRRAALGALCGAAALTLPRAARAAEPLQVVATTGMIGDVVASVGGAEVQARSLMGPGLDPHAFRPTRTDILAMARADMVAWHGLGLEAQLEPFLADLAGTKPVVALGETVPEDRLIPHDEYADAHDPHVWMDPELWALVALAARDHLAEVRPGAASAFTANAEAYGAEAARLHGYAQEVLASVPEAARVLVTAHDAFAYFGRAYGFEVLGIQGISTESEAGLNRIGELVEVLVGRGIGAVFVESSVSDRNIRALIEGAAARGHEVIVGGELFSDAMGPAGSYEGTWVGMIDHNVTTIAGALGGRVPQRGLNGRLSAGL